MIAVHKLLTSSIENVEEKLGNSDEETRLFDLYSVENTLSTILDLLFKSTWLKYLKVSPFSNRQKYAEKD